LIIKKLKMHDSWERGSEKRSKYLQEMATNAGYVGRVDEYIDALKKDQIELQPIEIPQEPANKPLNHWDYVAHSYLPTGKWKD